jgi:tetratricopeptide (TPR) repeat protein
MAFRFLRRFQLSPRNQRRLARLGANTFAVITYPVRLVYSLLKSVVRTVANWWESRNLRYLLQGLPSFMIGIGILVLGALIFFQDRAVLATEYRNQGGKALYEAEQAVRSSKDGKAAIGMAQTCFKRLSILPGDHDETSYFMARTYDLQRQPQAAEKILQTLAPTERPTNPAEKNKSYGPAHLALGKRLMYQPRPTPAMLQNAEQHLLRAVHWGAQLKGNTTTAEANAYLFDLYRATNRPAEAEKNLVAAVNSIGALRPDLRLQLAAWYQIQGKREPTVRQAELAAKAFRERLDDNPDDHGARGGLIDCLMMTGDFAGAKEQCQQGASFVPNTPLAERYVLTLIRVLIAWYDARTADAKSTPEERFGLLEQVMFLNPNDPKLLERLILFTHLTGAEAEKAKAAFRKLTDAGAPSATAHLMLGTDAWQQGDEKSARHHWEKAFEYSQGAPLVANNLAWMLAHTPPVDLNRALAMIEAALEKANDVRFHGTRGHILAKLDRHKEAVAELELAIVAYPEDVKLFEQLAESCAQIGRTTDAEHYKKHAEDLRKAKPKAKPTAGPTATPAKDPATDSKADPKVPVSIPKSTEVAPATPKPADAPPKP